MVVSALSIRDTMLVGIVVAVFVVLLLLSLVYVAQPKNFARAFRVSLSCHVSVPPTVTMQQMYNCNVYSMFTSKPKRIIFFPGGAFIRCCIDYEPFTETALQGYEVVMVQYRTLLQINSMRPVVKDCAQVLSSLLGSKKPTLVVGYSAGGYMAARAIQEANVSVPFLGMHGYYNLTTDYLLAFYSWLYLHDKIRTVDATKTWVITGDKDPLEESTSLFASHFGVDKQVVPLADHFTFYDLKRNQPYVDYIVKLMTKI